MKYLKYVKIGAVFAVCLLLYFIPSLIFKADPSYYKSLNLPSYAPPAVLFGIAWPILYALFSIYLAIESVNKDLPKEMIVYFI
ncbi:MAG: tryptophan-rich sensory protein, partial [Anaeroplasmataceae bacterium]|nr:tryptophan-rich sensory protein [Anaeroplasmataceae bacterium]